MEQLVVELRVSDTVEARTKGRGREADEVHRVTHLLKVGTRLYVLTRV
jgi:hypothetical protein